MPTATDLRHWLLRRWGLDKERGEGIERLARAENRLRDTKEQATEVAEVVSTANRHAAINYIARDVIDIFGARKP